MSPDCSRSVHWGSAQGGQTNTGYKNAAVAISDPDVRAVYENVMSETAPAVDANHVYVTDANGIAAISRSSGERTWSHSVDDYKDTSPVVNCGIVYLQTGNQLVALDAANGDKYWTVSRGHGVGQPNLVGTEEGVIIGTGSQIHSLGHHGAFKWQSAKTEHVVSGLACDGETVYITTSTESGGTVLALDEVDGRSLWQADGIRSIAPPVVHDETVYVMEKQGHVTALDGKNGDEIWRVDFDGESTYSSPSVNPAANHLYAPAGLDDEVVALSTTDGTIKWRTDVGNAARHTVINDGETVYVPGMPFVALDALDGTVRWRLDEKTGTGKSALTQEALWVHAENSLLRVTAR